MDLKRSNKGECTSSKAGSGRQNGNGVDLNRAFPTWDDLSLSKEDLIERREPEVSAVVNYPYDDSHSNERSGIKSPTPDDSTFVSLAKLYANKHKTMWQGGLCNSDTFTDGITNGAEWYVVKGGMQDFNYLYSNCMELSLELSCCKYPLETTLQGHWEDNKESLLGYLEAVQRGVRGIVTSETGEPLANANIQVAGIDKNITTTSIGEYWRLLSPGKYCIRASSPDNAKTTNWVQINMGGLDSKKHVRIDFKFSDNKDNLTNTDCDLIDQVLPRGVMEHIIDEDEGMNKIDTGAEEEKVLEFNR